jgi:hypothetical protein
MRFVVLPLLFILNFTFAQKESYDFLDYSVPIGAWVKNSGNDFISYSLTESQKGYCLFGIYKAIPSAGSLENDALADWNEFAVKRYPDVSTPSVKTQLINGTEWVQVQRTATATKDNASILISVITFSGYHKRMTVLFENSNGAFDHFLGDFFSSLVIHPAVAESVQPATPSNSITNNTPVSIVKPTSIVGHWKKSVASYANPSIGYFPVTQGYTKYNYEFKDDHTYTFYMEQWSINLACMFFQNESGTYTLQGNQLTLTPTQSMFEKRGLNNGRGVPGGPLLQSEKMALTPVTYQWTFYFLSGLGEWNLVLQTSSPTQRDGDFSNSAAFEKAYLYSQVK